jgi:glutathione synthase/RimK-type ligase-like ATP-grasp enzyme
MKICVISPRAASESARKLANALKADYSNPFDEDRRDYTKYDLVFNYGCNRKIVANQVINQKGVAACIDKIRCYETLKGAKIPTVNYVLKKEDIPDNWDIIVHRETVNGHGGEGLDYAYSKKDAPAGKAFYAEYYSHEQELRVVVFKGVVIGIYDKVDQNGMTEFIELEDNCLRFVSASCIEAATALGIDYVGFDVLYKSPKRFLVLEANSGPIITDEVIKYIKENLN